MSVLEAIEEQCSFGFTGRINVLKSVDRQYLGVILLLSGKVVSSHFAKKTGATALYSLVICDLEDLEDFKLVVEPEIVEDEDVEFSLSLNDLRKKVTTIYEDHNKSKKLKPPENLRILINPEFIEKGEKPNSLEFSILKVMSEFNKVADIYKNCDLFDFEITKGLVSLRKKGAIKVFK